MRRMRELANRPKATSSASHETGTSTSTRIINTTSRRDIRTLPPWIGSYEDSGDTAENIKPTTRLLPTPPRAHNAQHNHAPSQPTRRSQDGFVDTYDESSRLSERKVDTGFFGSKEPAKGRKWDHAREREPIIMQSGVQPTSSQWTTYLKSSMYGPGRAEDGEIMDEAYLERQTPGYQQPWRGDMDGTNDPEKMSGLIHNPKQRRSLIKRWQNIILLHPLVPLIFRVTVLATSVIALGLSATVYHLSNKYRYAQNPSTTMAIIVDVVALPYIGYITYDEYTGKPLGLRSPKAKIRLVLLDLFFIIFESANLALAFGALTDNDGSCRAGKNGTNLDICGRVKALCSILMVALIAWSLTFSVSIFRLVERVGGREEAD
ncbi:hypothetical protein BJ875DRAFT_479907 [Amylocarpus encephaloides]|uniref:Casparian strip membrane protein domain-containing protein n=1 Tax=Amylocarpus encephaloides TaxID=45428 RepID=A0A9P7YTL3_9HELO|nr:hypothetical protein BJ875DRAFT_479907 [Amylocarpus encephaloides]